MPGPPPVPGPLPLPVPVPVPDPIPPPLPGPAPAVPAVPDPAPVPALPVAGTSGTDDGCGVAAFGTTDGIGLGNSTGLGVGATTAAASGTVDLSRTYWTRCPAAPPLPAEPPPPPPAGPGPPPPIERSASKLFCAAGSRIRTMTSACAKREAAICFHRPSLLLGTPTGGL